MRIASAIGFVFGVGLVLGAHQTPARQVWIDSRFTEVEKRQVRAAISAWQEAARGEMLFFIVSEKVARPSGSALVAIEKSIVRGITIDRDLYSPHLDWLGWTREQGEGEVHVIAPRIPGKTCESISLEWITAHEIGHALGLGHADGPSLMGAPCNEMATCVDQVSIDRLAHHQGLERSRMAPGCLPVQ